MSLDLSLLGSKLSRYRAQFQLSVADVSARTAISDSLVKAYEKGEREPTGDHILILADFLKCDYKFFVSNERVAPFDETETLFRMHGDVLSAADRWAIQEFLFLCECEEELLRLTQKVSRSTFTFTKYGKFFKRHGEEAAAMLRRQLGYAPNEVRMDVYADFRSIGLHVFRRQLGDSSISGLFVRHPVAGLCVLINYSEDVYRQRFTAAHEAGHAILDTDKSVNLSLEREAASDLSEVRANTFASRYLMPPEFLNSLPNTIPWTDEDALNWANNLKVSTTALSFALRDAGIIDNDIARRMRRISVPAEAKRDPELPDTLSVGPKSRKTEMLKRGLSGFYVDLCFQAYEQALISSGRLAEMLLTTPQEIHLIASEYGRKLRHDD